MNARYLWEMGTEKMESNIKNGYAEKLIKFIQKYKYVLIVIVAGILLMQLPGIGGATENTAQIGQWGGEYQTETVEQIEKKIREALRLIEGIGRAEVVLTLNSSIETLYQTDLTEGLSLTDMEEESEVAVKTVLFQTGSGYQSALVVKRVYPEYRGALIVCEGGDMAAIKLEVTKAVSALTGLSSDKITVAKHKSV